MLRGAGAPLSHLRAEGVSCERRSLYPQTEESQTWMYAPPLPSKPASP